MKPKFLDQYHAWLTERYAVTTAYRYRRWAAKLICYHAGKIHPEQMTAAQVEAFVNHQIGSRQLSAATITQLHSALAALFNDYLNRPGLISTARVRRGRSLPAINLSQSQVLAIIAETRGDPKLILSLIYGAGLRVSEALGLRCADLDFAAGQITLPGRTVPLPASLIEPLQAKCTLADADRLFTISDRTLAYHLKKAVATLDLSSTITANHFRQAYIIYLFQQGATDAQVRDLTGLSPTSIARYRRFARPPQVTSPLDEMTK